MDQKNTMLIIVGFVALLLGVSLLGVIATEEQELVSKSVVTNESITFTTCRTVGADPTLNETGVNCNFTITYAPTGWKVNDETPCPLTSFAMRNFTGDTMTSGTDYVADLTNGIVNLRNTTALGGAIDANQYNVSYVDYLYCGDDYVNQSWQRSILNVVVGMFGIALLIVAVGIFYAVIRNEKLLGI